MAAYTHVPEQSRDASPVDLKTRSLIATLNSSSSKPHPSKTQRPSIFGKSYRSSLWVSLSVFVGYIGYYFARVHFPTAAPSIIEEGVLDKGTYSQVISIAYFMNVVGKIGGGAIVDIINRPKLVFLVALFIGAAVAVLNTFLTSVNWFMFLWSLTRFFTSFGFGSVLKISAAWWPPELIGTILGFASLSCCLGESLTRVVLGLALKVLSWRKTYFLAAGIAIVLSIPTILFVRDQPPALSVPNRNSSISLLSKTSKHTFRSLSKKSEKRIQRFFRHVVLPLVKSHRFMLNLLMAVCATILRETFNSWTAIFLHDLGVPESDAAIMSSIFSFAGSISTVLGGFLVDLIARKRRGLIPLVFLIFLTLFQVGLFFFSKYQADWNSPAKVPVALVLIAGSAFSLWAPYSLFDGVFVMDVIGTKGIAFGSGVISGVSYLAAGFAMSIVGRMANTDDPTGWMSVWATMAVLAGIATLTCIGYWILDSNHVLNELRNEVMCGDGVLEEQLNLELEQRSDGFDDLKDISLSSENRII